MKKLLVFTLAWLLLCITQGSHSQEPNLADLRAANDAWQNGQYADALRGYQRLLKSSVSEQFLEAIALQTGELFQTTELTTDGRNPKLSPDGKLIVYETGPAKATVTRVVAVANPAATLAELPGIGAAIAPAGRKVVYLKLPASDELVKAQAALDSAQGIARIGAQQALTRLQGKLAQLIVRDLTTRQEVELPTAGLLKTSPVFAADGETVFFVGVQETQTNRNDVYAFAPGALQPVVVTDAEGFKTAPVVDPNGKVLLVTMPNANPFAAPRPVPNQPAGNAAADTGQGAGQGGGQGRGGGGGGGGFGGATRFGIVDLATRKVRALDGTAFTLADDGSTVAYLTRNGQENSLNVIPTSGGDPSTVLKTTDRLDAPAFAPDGQRLAYQRMTRDDWEVYLIQRDGKNETRLTREIQHDLLPRFLGPDRLLGVIGEPRHRRSYLYDLKTNQRLRLFHNNTVRTIAPEYNWAASPDGTKLLIQADRDGDTVSNERGVYLMDLSRRVTKAELLARLEKNLAAEVALQTEGQKMYAPIAADVRGVVAQASTNRIFEYEKMLFDFDSKHISRPGNKLASEYLFGLYKSFGYEPEYQWFEPRGALGGKTANVVAKLTGTENPELIYVVGSHYDSVAVGPGADDDTSGTAALLEAARVLAKHPQPATIIFASFTGEEAGLLGSREFVRRAQADKLQIAGALNNDMIGWANDNRLDNTIRYSNDGIRDIQHAAALQFTRLITYDSRYHRSTDATAFFEAYGDIVGGIGSYPVLGNPHYHQPHDWLEGINHQLITETSKTTVATLMLLASSPARLKDLKVVSYNGKTAELSWAAAPEKSVKSYVVTVGNGPRVKVTAPRVSLPNVAPGTVVSVKAVNARGLESWDWARVAIAVSATASGR
ncbi:MAG: M20/M25/M40 family metallo-hydrolase [Acidobacteria bacterium]|nr:M20/M25/M40 family metallo-hydrolase [Acidobacteriota bacterium]MBI3422788.1 M20/M25/M40 family metallo-hydrolase [Acidobacteriota bacterium]